MLEAFPRPDGTFSTIGGGVWILWIPAVLQGLFVSFCTLSSLRETQIYSGMALLCIADFALVQVTASSFKRQRNDGG